MPNSVFGIWHAVHSIWWKHANLAFGLFCFDFSNHECATCFFKNLNNKIQKSNTTVQKQTLEFVISFSLLDFCYLESPDSKNQKTKTEQEMPNSVLAIWLSEPISKAQIANTKFRIYLFTLLGVSKFRWSVACFFLYCRPTTTTKIPPPPHCYGAGVGVLFEQNAVRKRKKRKKEMRRNGRKCAAMGFVLASRWSTAPKLSVLR